VRRKIDKVYHTIEKLDESWPEPTIPDPTLRRSQREAAGRIDELL